MSGRPTSLRSTDAIENFRSLFDAKVRMWVDLVQTAREYADAHSGDPVTPVGALLLRPDGALIISACNTMPRGVQQLPTRWKRPEKYRFVEHAERNAVYTWTRLGLKTQGSTAVLTLFCCTECARPDLQCGRWGTDWLSAREILDEAGVEILWAEAT